MSIKIFFSFLFVALLTSCRGSALEVTPEVLPTLVPTSTMAPVPTATLTLTSTPTMVPAPDLPIEEYANSLNVTIDKRGEIPDKYIRDELDGIWALQRYACDNFELCDFFPKLLLVGDEVPDGSCGTDIRPWIVNEKRVTQLVIYQDILDCKGGLSSSYSSTDSVEQVYENTVTTEEVLGTISHEMIHGIFQWELGCTQREINAMHGDWSEGLAEYLHRPGLAYSGMSAGFPVGEYSDLPQSVWKKLTVENAIKGVISDADTNWTNETILGWHLMDYLIQNKGGVQNIIKVWRNVCGDQKMTKSQSILSVYAQTEEQLYTELIP